MNPSVKWLKPPMNNLSPRSHSFFYTAEILAHGLWWPQSPSFASSRQLIRGCKRGLPQLCEWRERSQRKLYTGRYLHKMQLPLFGTETNPRTKQLHPECTVLELILSKEPTPRWAFGNANLLWWMRVITKPFPNPVKSHQLCRLPRIIRSLIGKAL